MRFLLRFSQPCNGIDGYNGGFRFVMRVPPAHPVVMDDLEVTHDFSETPI